MKYFVGLILSLISGTVLAGAVPFPACNINNQPVTYISVISNHNNAYVQGYIAGSDIVNGKHIIGYNSHILSNKPKEWSLQVMLHECGHIKLHASKNYKPALKEHEADCYSAKVLKNQYGYGDKEFAVVINTMKELPLPPDRIIAFESCTRH